MLSRRVISTVFPRVSVGFRSVFNPVSFSTLAATPASSAESDEAGAAFDSWTPSSSQILRFSQRQYLHPGGGLYHPGSYKVTLRFYLRDLKLNEKEAEIFKVLVGPRFNEETEEVLLTCDSFQQRVDNKAKLVSILGDLLKESRARAV